MADEDPRATVVDPDPRPVVGRRRVRRGHRSRLADRTWPTDGKRKRSGLVEWIIVVVVAISSALLVRAYVLQQFAVEGTSMLTTLHPSDRVLVNKLSYRLHDPRRGDVVVLKRIETNAQERDLIKRVVALPGETIEYRELPVVHRRLAGQRAVPRPARSSRRTAAAPTSPPSQVEPNHVFVMGDNRGGSLDSRDDSVGPDRLQQPDRPRLRGDVAVLPTGSGCSAVSGRTWPRMSGGHRRLRVRARHARSSTPTTQSPLDADVDADRSRHRRSPASPSPPSIHRLAHRRHAGDRWGAPPAVVRRPAVRRRRAVDAQHAALRRPRHRQQAELRRSTIRATATSSCSKTSRRASRYAT